MIEPASSPKPYSLTGFRGKRLAGRRIDHVLALAAFAAEPFSVDEESEL